ncbi:MAG: hypothetical protein AAGI68_01600 [Planctomycetota bacterium]
MKNDDSSLLKKHFEKLLLAGATLFLVVVAAMFFTDTLGNPFAVEVSGQDRSPADVVALLDTQSSQLSARIKTADPIGPPPNIPDYSQDFADRRTSPVASDEPLPVPIHDTSYALIDAEAITIDLPLLYVPPVPLPEAMVADQYAFVLDEGSVNRNDVLLALRRQIGEQRPPDFAMVSVRGFWDQEGWIAELDKTHRVPGYEEAPLTPEIYGDKTFPVGVYLLRQTLDPATGTWGAPNAQGVFTEGGVTRCPPLPNAYQAMLAVNDRPTGSDPDQFLEFLQLPELRAITVTPDLPPLAHGDIWFPPGAAPQPAAPEPDMPLGFEPPPGQRDDRLRRGELQRLEREERRRQLRDEGPPRSGSRAELDRQRRERLALERQRGFDAAAMPNNARRLPDVPLEIVAPAGSIIVWAHDLTARPGQTYRYKLAVNAINPLFGFARLPPEQIDMAQNQPAVGPGEEQLANAPWGPPVAVEPMLEFFVTGGRAGQPATVEVYRRHDGRWHTETFQPAPGDLIGAADVQGQINMDTGAVVVDILSERDDQGTEINSLLLVDETGLMQVRNINADRRSDRRTELKSRIENQQLAANNRAAGVQP